MKKGTKTALAAGTIAVLGAAGFGSISLASDHGWRRHGPEHYWHDGFGGKHGMYGPRFLELFDTNNDGKVTQEEIDSKRKELFAKYDADGDGKLSRKEYEPLWLEMHQRRIARSFQRLDDDADAAVTEEEFNAPFSGMVARMDRDSDGALTVKDRRGRGWHHGRRRGWWHDGDEDDDRGYDDDRGDRDDD